MSKENESIKNISLPNECIEYAEREAKRFGISFTKYMCSLIDNQMHENSCNKGSRLIALSTEERTKILANYPNL